MPNFTNDERIGFNFDFDLFYKAQHRAEMRDVAINDLYDYKLNEALNEEKVFATLEDDYEVVSAFFPQIMRALREMDKAAAGDEIAKDAVFNALGQIKGNLERILREQAATEYDERME